MPVISGRGAEAAVAASCWRLCTPCRDDNPWVISVEGQEDMDEACETLDFNDPTVRQGSLGRARATSVACTRCGIELDYKSVLICCACKQLYCPGHCVSELCDTCYSPPDSDKESVRLPKKRLWERGQQEVLAMMAAAEAKEEAKEKAEEAVCSFCASAKTGS